MISKRAQKLKNAPSAIVEGQILCASSPFDKKDNPEGYLNMGIAQNHLMDDLLINKINKLKTKIDPSHIQYNWIQGRADLQKAISDYFHNFLNIPDIDPNKITVQAGVSALCESLSFNIFDKGDYLMLASPYYTGFEHDFQKRFGVNFLEVDLANNDFKHSIAPFKKVYKDFSKKEKVKAILICHPHNPTGEILSEEFLNDLVKFAKKNKLQIISDEIYAMSTFEQTKHVSLFQKARQNQVVAHLLYGLAKDFSLAGFKVGFHYSDNQETVDAMQSLCYFYPVSSYTQQLVTDLLSEKSFLTQYFTLNSERLNKTFSYIINEIENIKYIPSQSGLFFLLDLSKHIKTFKEEENIHKTLLNKYKVSLTQGKYLGLSQPGYFRVCFAKYDDEVKEFCQRMKKFYDNEIQ